MNKIRFTFLVSIAAVLLLTACSAVPLGLAASTDIQTDDVFVADNSAGLDETTAKAISVDVKAAAADNADLGGFTLADCAAEDFLDVQADPRNSAYADPELDVSCDGDTVTIQTNNIPNFEFVATTPNALSEQNYTFSIPQNPQIADQVSDVPLGGPSAVTVTGLVIFGPTEAPQHGYRDPYLDQILDYCNGHTAPGGVYHFHARPDCIYEEIDGQVALVIGYAFDGFPILSPYVCADDACTELVELQSSWQMTNPEIDNAWEQHEYVAGSGDLDQCNGMYLEDGSYVYFATDTFPYFMGCYVGEVNGSNQAGVGQDGGGQAGGQAGGAGQAPDGANGPGSGQGGQGGPPQGAPPSGGGGQGGPNGGGGSGRPNGGGGGGQP